jgi:hypothetical protein
MRASSLLKLGAALLLVLCAVTLSTLPEPGASWTAATSGAAWAPMDDAGAAPAGDDPAQPEAACRIMPECGSDADCNAVCGIGLGKCIHSRCPIRICRCG